MMRPMGDGSYPPGLTQRQFDDYWACLDERSGVDPAPPATCYRSRCNEPRVSGYQLCETHLDEHPVSEWVRFEWRPLT